MASQLRFTGIVLKKTKLGESDLIITFLAEDGSAIQAVAKGARKPKSSFASRLELFSCAELFCAQSKGLPLVQEARLSASHQQLRVDFERSTAASVVAEVITKSIHEEVPAPKLFALCEASLSALEAAPEKDVYPLALATCLKVFAFTGVRPSFAQCVSCGCDVFAQQQEQLLAFSVLEGGSLCAECAEAYQSIREPKNLLQWMNLMLYATFDQVKDEDIPTQALSFGFHFVQEWTRTHMGSSLKSVPFLLTNASFPGGEC